MNARSQEHYEARAGIARALGHPSRLRILDLLDAEELCVGELTERVGADQSTVSKHLAVLRNAGLVGARKQGSRTWYRLTCPCLQGFFECIERVLREKLEDLRARIEPDRRTELRGEPR